VIFPADASPRSSAVERRGKTFGGLGDWWLVIGAIALGAIVIAVALVVR
jgi:hypothetical protein